MLQIHFTALFQMDFGDKYTIFLIVSTDPNI